MNVMLFLQDTISFMGGASLKRYIKGISLTLFISLIATFINHYILTSIETLTLGIFIAILWRNILGIKSDYSAGVNFSAKEVLKWGIILLGLRLNLVTLSQLGLKVLITVLFLVAFGQIAAYYMGNIFGLNKKLAVLLGIGSSICGTSAIVALGPVIDADEESTTLAATIISLLGTIGVLTFSFLAFVLPLSDTAFGVWAGISLQNVPHALAGAFARSEIAGDVGTLVKMGRVALLAPTAIVYSLLFRGDDAKEKKKAKVPSYVLGFLLVGILASINNYFEIFPWTIEIGNFSFNLYQQLRTVGNWFVLIAMVGMGLQADVGSFKSKGLQAFVSCSLLFVTICIVSYGLIVLLSIG